MSRFVANLQMIQTGRWGHNSFVRKRKILATNKTPSFLYFYPAVHITKKIRRHSGRETPSATISLKNNQDPQLEPQEHWNDWNDYRDGMRNYGIDRSKKYKICCHKLEYRPNVLKDNRKHKVHEKRRKARKVMRNLYGLSKR